MRLPATDQAHKKGTIFFNPGGPGGSGVEFVLGVGPFLYSDQVRARFDLVGFDPRGIIESSPLICFDSLDEAVATFWPFAFPMNQAEIRIAKHLDRQLINACDARGGAIQDHMATADVARDLDRLREAVGDFRLNYVGYSYGSFLGTTYANMFPNRVGAVVVDAVLDPIAWTTGRGRQDWKLPFSTRLHSDMGAQDTLDEFFRLCDEAGAGECAFAPNASDRFAALADLLKAGPIEVTDPETGETFLLRYSDLISGSLGELYNSFDWHPFAETLAFLEAAVGLSSTRAAADASARAFLDRARFQAPYPNFVEGFPGVACSDSNNPNNYFAWRKAGIEADEQFGYFGRLWTWVSAICAKWTAHDEDRYLGPFNKHTANPVLVVGNLFDPATRYQGAQIVDNLLPNSSLLTVEGWGHTSLFLSACADDVVSRYLLTRQVPAGGATCSQDFSPFDPQTTSKTAQRQLLRAQALENVGLVPRW